MVLLLGVLKVEMKRQYFSFGTECTGPQADKSYWRGLNSPRQCAVFFTLSHFRANLYKAATCVLVFLILPWRQSFIEKVTMYPKPA